VNRSGEIRVRPIEPRDAEDTARLHVAVWEDAYAGLMPDRFLVERRAGIDDRIEAWHRIIASSPASTTVAEHAGELVGFVSVGPARDDDVDLDEELWALYVSSAWWSAGVGHRLLTTVLGERPAYLWVLEGNERAIGFYRRQGFVLDGAVQEAREGRHLRMVRRAGGGGV
jgi:ribosomal protein S18 acetylase RimI-like enzyme